MKDLGLLRIMYVVNLILSVSFVILYHSFEASLLLIISELLSQNNFGEERTKVERTKNHPVITSNIKKLSEKGWLHKPKDRTRAVSSGIHKYF